VADRRRYRLGDKAAIDILLWRCHILRHVDFTTLQMSNSAQGVERAVDCNAMRPGAELCIASITRQCAEDLHPYLLRDVRRQIGVTAQPPYHSVDVGSVLDPKRPQRGLVPMAGTLKD
jgi:hypothetical protein